MTADTPTRPSAAPAAGLFGSGRPAQAPLPPRAEPTATQRKSFADLFRADGEELHAA
jgi:hypothetical protein